MVLTSEGIPIIAEGDEFLRSKVVNGDYSTAMNSYNASDAVNAIHWGDKTTNAAVFTYYKDAIALRRVTPALRLTTWDAIHNQMTATVDGSVVIGRLSSNPGAPTTYDTVVVDNPTSSTYNVTLPPGTWTKVLDATGTVAAGDNACEGLAVTVFKKN
jgi:pullulanase